MLDINIRTMNVELSRVHVQQIYRHIGPLLRLTSDVRHSKCDVVIRGIRRPLSGTLHCVMIRLNTDEQKYYSIGMDRVMSRAISGAADELRRTMSQSYVPDTMTLSRMRTRANAQLFKRLLTA